MSVSGPIILTDADVDRLADMRTAIEAVEKAFLAKAKGAFVAPARHRVSFGPTTELVFTIGGGMGPGATGGVRAYYSRNTIHFDDQVVAVWDMESGALRGVAIGAALGTLRMGAIGGVAIRVLAKADAGVLAMIGAGRQAEAHLAAAATVRDLREVRVFARTQETRNKFIRRMSEKIEVNIKPAATAEEAVRDADIVILATTSYRPVIQAEWLAAGALVHTVGFKSPVGKEMDLDVPERADLLVTDSPAQIEASGKSFVLFGTPHLSRIADLSQIVAGKVQGRQDDSAIIASYPMGMAGTAVVVADALIMRAQREAAGG